MLELKKNGCSIRNMVKILNDNNVFNRDNAIWTRSSVHRILQAIEKHKSLLEI